jgi:sigma-B regulation protein RsbU (phosphoserine phosphatase)
MLKTRPWQEELAIIDRTMKAISGIRDPEQLVEAYWNGIGELLEIGDYVALSRRNVEPPHYLITRSSRFTEHPNPWTQRERLPKMTGGLLGEIAYANKPVMIDDLPARLQADDPGRFYLEGFASLVALPTYDGGEGLNVTVMLVKPGQEMDRTRIPVMHWQTSLFGRGTTNMVLRNQLSDALAALDRELQVVGAIQRSLLPRELPAIEGFEIAAYYETSARAGGDYYDFFPLAGGASGGAWGLFISDVSGHGTPAAVLMAITHAIAHSQPGTHKPPAALLEYLNRQLAAAYTREGTFVTAFYAVLDPATRRLTYSRAGHNPPRLVRGERVMPLDETGALPLGIAADEVYLQAAITLERGDLLLLYTDGITEAMAPRKVAEGGGENATPTPSSAPPSPLELFGVDRLDAVVAPCRSCAAGACIARVLEEVRAFSENAPAADDRTLIALRCLESLAQAWSGEGFSRKECPSCQRNASKWAGVWVAEALARFHW